MNSKVKILICKLREILVAIFSTIASIGQPVVLAVVVIGGFLYFNKR